MVVNVAPRPTRCLLTSYLIPLALPPHNPARHGYLKILFSTEPFMVRMLHGYRLHNIYDAEAA